LLQSRLPLRARREERKACARPQWTPVQLLAKFFPIFLPQPRTIAAEGRELHLPIYPGPYSSDLPQHNTTPSPHPRTQPTFFLCTLSINTNIFSNFAAHPALLPPTLAKPIAVAVAVARWSPAPHLTSLQKAARRGAFPIPIVTQTSPSPHTRNLEQNNLHLLFPLLQHPRSSISDKQGLSPRISSNPPNR
jgi:hypothetical protein